MSQSDHKSASVTFKFPKKLTVFSEMNGNGNDSKLTDNDDTTSEGDISRDSSPDKSRPMNLTSNSFGRSSPKTGFTCHSGLVNLGSSNPATLASVQAAFAALQAGQMSLNQVKPI